MTATAWKTKNPPGEIESIYLLLSDPDGNILFASNSTKERYILLRSNTSAIHLSEVLFENDRNKMQSVLGSVLNDLEETSVWLNSSGFEDVQSKRCWFFYPVFGDNSETLSFILCVSSINYDEFSENMIKPLIMPEERAEALRFMGQPLREPAYYLDLVLNHSYNSFILLDTNLRVVFFNKVAAEFYQKGFGHELYAGLDFYETIHEDLKEERRILFNEKVLKGEIAEVLGKIPSDQGSRILLNTYFPIYNENSVISGIGLISTDITEKEKVKNELVRSEQFFKSLISDSLDGICLTDTDGIISYVAPSCYKILGFEPGELIGRSCFDIVHPDDQAIARSGFQDEAQRKPRAKFYEIRLRNKLGQWLWMMVRAHNMLDNSAVNAIVIFFSDLTTKKEADFARIEAERKARQNSDHIANILHSITDGFAAFDRQFTVILWNHVSENFTGIKAGEILNRNIWSRFPQYINSRIFYEFKMAMERNVTVNFTEYLSKLQRWIEFSAYPSTDGLFVYFKDVTHRKQQEMVMDLERQVFEMNTKIDASLKNTVDFFLSGIERIFPGMICSVHLMDNSGDYLLRFSAPSLPSEYMNIISDLRIGPKVGSCGTAAFRKETVVVSDIQNDDLWNDYKEIANEFGLSACWSFPILNHDGNVLATFAIYYSVVKTPTEDEFNSITKFARMLGILMEKEKAEEKLRISNERYKFATRATNEAIWDWDLRTDEIYWGDGFRILFGYNLPRGRGDYKLWLKCVHPADRKKVDKLYYGTNLRELESNTIETEYRFMRADGTYSQVVDRGYLIFDENGEAIRMVGSMRDMTEYKKLQAHVLQEELNRHKLVVEATIGAQEKERAEIGKELHDNINQILSTTKLYIELAKSEEGRRMELLQMSAKNINYAINEIRNLSHSLVPPSLKDLGLVESIFDVIAKIRMTQSFNIEFDFNDLSLETQITLDQKLTLYRIVQEQLNNIIKHANATNVSIELSMVDGFIRLLIIDDGNGFDAERAKKGVGLNNIFNRAEFHEGTAELETTPGKGCKLLVMIPEARMAHT